MVVHTNEPNSDINVSRVVKLVGYNSTQSSRLLKRYRVSHGKLLKLIGNYFEMHASIKMAQIAFKSRHFEVCFRT